MLFGRWIHCGTMCCKVYGNETTLSLKRVRCALLQSDLGRLLLVWPCWCPSTLVWPSYRHINTTYMHYVLLFRMKNRNDRYIPMVWCTDIMTDLSHAGKGSMSMSQIMYCDIQHCYALYECYDSVPVKP